MSASLCTLSVVVHFDISILIIVSSDYINYYENNSMINYIGRKYIVLDYQTHQKKG